MIALFRRLGLRSAPQPVVTWRTPAEYLRTREAGRNTVRVVGSDE